jgi:penicillin-binding protein 1A
MYLNKVYFGDGLYGAEAAALGYFGKHASDLDVSEAALLAGVIKGPSAYAPTVNRTRALARRTAALRAMHAAGFIDGPTFDAAATRELELVDGLRAEKPHGLYFKEELRKQLVRQFGWERVYEGGLKVYTTLEPELQAAAEAEVERAIDEIEKRQRTRSGAPDEPLQAALVALDARTGAVLAMVGGRSFDESRFNRVTQARRQAGSAFKPFVYAAALERGFTPASVITDLDTPVMTVEGAWVPDDHSTSPTMTMRTALRVSSNRAAVRMLEEIGIRSALRAAADLGIESVPGVPSLALGSGEVTLLSMTSAYSAFANEGIRAEPGMIRRVETADGEVLYSSVPRTRRAVTESTAFLMTSMLSDVINGGTAWQARRAGFTQPAAGKTGTTNDYRDAWFVGYTRSLVTGVWVGYDRPRTIMREGYAATLAVPLWGRFMARATKASAPQTFRRPRSVTSATICPLSGLLATSACRYAAIVGDDGSGNRGARVITEYFARGTQPTSYCPWHTQLAVPAAVATSGSTTEELRVGPPAAAASASATPPPPAAGTASPPEQPQPRRRGFWGRLFGR